MEFFLLHVLINAHSVVLHEVLLLGRSLRSSSEGNICLCFTTDCNGGLPCWHPLFKFSVRALQHLVVACLPHMLVLVFITCSVGNVQAQRFRLGFDTEETDDLPPPRTRNMVHIFHPSLPLVISTLQNQLSGPIQMAVNLYWPFS